MVKENYAQTKAYLGLGSNLGDKVAGICAALAMLKDTPGVKLLRVAPFYRTAPVGYTQQDWFVNTVAEVKTNLLPEELLNVCLGIENRLGRVRTIHWGPRVIDLDLLLYDGQMINKPQLTVPHPRLHERAFVLVPLVDLAPELAVPGQGRVDHLLAAVDPGQRETVYKLPGDFPCPGLNQQ